MIPDAQRIAIAIACGFSHVRCVPPDHCIGHHPARPSQVPDYLNDLNAMHEAEKVLTAEQQLTYAKLLHRWTTQRHYLHADFELLHMPAAIRAEAFLKTLGLWEESKT